MIFRGNSVFHFGKGVVQLGIYEREIPGSKLDLHTMIVELIVNPLAAKELVLYSPNVRDWKLWKVIEYGGVDCDEVRGSFGEELCVGGGRRRCINLDKAED
ncbi:hypothetical protein HYALB_00002149 [Hymenoscyphus albidus]|uniref:Uncharacterized protein n=1 Tax=Hymenoscyphus albidus TaxID=595503 RepID=A0A9N9PVM1_9HELO|nr:hypothetical protein HYALB_00002149 [Hymenoscyphus albidus]